MADTITSNPTLSPYTGVIDLSRPCFVGVGGSAMSGLAQLCAARGARVRGTDAVDSDRLWRLRAAGCSVSVGHDSSAVQGASCVVYTAVASGAPEIVAARKLGIPVVHRMQVLQQLAADRRLVAVAGTHGKSTTTGMVVAGMRHLGLDPSYLLGADLADAGSGTHLGAGKLFVAEADESDRAFHFLTPAAAIVTTIAHDHPENYADLDAHVQAYVSFAARMREHGVLIVNADEGASQDMVRQLRRLRPDLRIVTFGQSAGADVRVDGFTRQGWNGHVQVTVNGGARCVIRLGSPSAQHGMDAVAALALLTAFELSPESAAEAVSAFQGVRRRFSLAGQTGGVTVIDCHADHHHEISADLDAARAVAGAGRVIAIVQPSGYARVKAFGRQIGAVLASGAYYTVLLDVHGAAPIPGVSSSIVGDAAIMAGGRVRFSTHHEVPALVAALASPGDVVVLLGTGDVGTLVTPTVNAIGAVAVATV